MSSKAALWAKNKKNASADDVCLSLSGQLTQLTVLHLQESSSSSAGTGNVLSEVTLPRPDLSGLKAMHPVRSRPLVPCSVSKLTWIPALSPQEDLVKASVGQVRAFPEPVLELFKSSSIPNSLKREVRRCSAAHQVPS